MQNRPEHTLTIAKHEQSSERRKENLYVLKAIKACLRAAVGWYLRLFIVVVKVAGVERVFDGWAVWRLELPRLDAFPIVASEKGVIDNIVDAWKSE